jgi:hypothetical protein
MGPAPATPPPMTATLISTRVAVAAMPAARAWAARSKDAGRVRHGRGRRIRPGRGPPARGEGAARDVGAAGDPLDAAARPARAGIAVEVDADVPDVARVAGRAGQQRSAEYQPAAHTGRHDHAQCVVVAAGRALPVFGRRHGDPVAGQDHGQAAGRPRHPRDEREVAPAGHVDGTDRPVRGVHRTRAADADGDHRGPLGGRAQFAEHLLDRAHDGLPVMARGRRPQRPPQQSALAVYERPGDLRSADVQCSHEWTGRAVGVHRSGVSFRRPAPLCRGGSARAVPEVVSPVTDNVVHLWPQGILRP